MRQLGSSSLALQFCDLTPITWVQLIECVDGSYSSMAEGIRGQGFGGSRGRWWMWELRRGEGWKGTDHRRDVKMWSAGWKCIGVDRRTACCLAMEAWWGHTLRFCLVMTHLEGHSGSDWEWTVEYRMKISLLLHIWRLIGTWCGNFKVLQSHQYYSRLSMRS